jgi:methylenetetrahydrofolate reductase (NADPH)
MIDPDIAAIATSYAGEREVEDRLARRPWPTTPIRAGLEVSFEFFPPANSDGTAALGRCVEALAPLSPSFVSVTYGAGGTTQARTQAAVELLAAVPGLPVAGHLTCVGATKAEVGDVIDSYLTAGVRHIVALRGDAPAGTDGTVADGYASALELVSGIRSHAERAGTDIDVSVAAYPEVHPRAASAQADLDHLKAKIDAGATRAITQFFFDTDVFLRFLDRARSAGITVPIVPGIMPVTNFANTRRFSERCGTTIPTWMYDLFVGLDDMPDVQQLVAATVAAEQCRRLTEHGVRQLHFYTMNKPELTAATCRILGIRPQATAALAAERAS